MVTLLISYKNMTQYPSLKNVPTRDEEEVQKFKGKGRSITCHEDTEGDRGIALIVL